MGVFFFLLLLLLFLLYCCSKYMDEEPTLTQIRYITSRHHESGAQEEPECTYRRSRGRITGYGLNERFYGW
jgi:hypothetical protein